MLTNLFGLLNLALLFVSLFALHLSGVNRKFSLAILQSLLFLPLLVAEYLVVALSLMPDSEGFAVLLASQNIFLVIWSTVARRLRDAMSIEQSDPITFLDFIHIPLVLLILGMTIIQIVLPGFTITPEGIRFSSFEPVYFASVVSLLVMLFMSWQLEAFWRQLPKTRRREYGLFVVSCALVCAVQGGVASYRLTYFQLTNEILFLQAMFLLVAWALLGFAVLRHRLLNRKLFISRKVVYTFAAPSLFAAYFFALGIISLIMRLTGYQFEWVLFWFLSGIGLVATAILAVSEPVRQRLKFFISTHFYVNKYEYRDEWLAFSALLQDAHSEEKVLEALHQVLADSLYTREIWIWTGSETKGFKLMVSSEETDRQVCFLTGKEHIIEHLRQHPFLDLSAPGNGEQQLFAACLASLSPSRPVFFVPLATGRHLVGLIGLGQEYTGGRYGKDDSDLLIALSSQAALALVAVRLTEETARLRELRALDNLSAFLLHDIKNAASILSLVHANAQKHMDKPAFRKDMLSAIEDALRRMDKVRANLGMLRERAAPSWQDIDLHLFFDELLGRFLPRLPGLDIVLDCPAGIVVRTDPQLLATVIENILLNAYEAGNDSRKVQITVRPDSDGLAIGLVNNGPAIAEQLLPDQLFQPFVSDKQGGSGIGLWQARLVLQRLGGAIMADNPAGGGARFVIRMPLANLSLASVDSAARV